MTRKSPRQHLRQPHASVLFLFVCVITTLIPSQSWGSECVILLHGLARSASSMTTLEKALKDQGYAVANIGYPSRSKPIQELASRAIENGIRTCGGDHTKIHFVTHSLGGILVRYYLKDQTLERLGRVVMIGPPNQGSQVVDHYKDIPGYTLINGPAGLQLGTDEHSIPLNLGPVAFEVGIIAGTRTFNPILSQSLPNPDDGKVSVENTKVEGMQDFIAVPHTHTFMMRADRVLQQTVHFLRHGRFQHTTE